MRPKISIIIPVLNEEKYIGKLLQYLLDQTSIERLQEIIVVDGGSEDGTVEVVSTFEGVLCISAPKGRAKQLNAGGRIAKGSILYFLHADTFPPLGFEQKILLEASKGAAGCFRLKFEHPNHYLLWMASWFTQFKSRFFRGGDQSLFISQKDFNDLGGFDETYIIYEDVEFVNRIGQAIPFTILNDYVVTSERRFTKNGTWKLLYNFFIIHLKKIFGASPEELHNYYVNHIRD